MIFIFPYKSRIVPCSILGRRQLFINDQQNIHNRKDCHILLEVQPNLGFRNIIFEIQCLLWFFTSLLFHTNAITKSHVMMCILYLYLLDCLLEKRPLTSTNMSTISNFLILLTMSSSMHFFLSDLIVVFLPNKHL